MSIWIRHCIGVNNVNIELCFPGLVYNIELEPLAVVMWSRLNLVDIGEVNS